MFDFSLPRFGESPKITWPLTGRLRTAVTQSVGAGCWFGGTPSIQIRHIPDGGRYAGGIDGLCGSFLGSPGTLDGSSIGNCAFAGLPAARSPAARRANPHLFIFPAVPRENERIDMGIGIRMVGATDGLKG